MFSNETHIKIVKRPYPPLYGSLIVDGVSRKEYYANLLARPYAMAAMVNAEDEWWYSKAELLEGQELVMESWRNPTTLTFVKEEFKKREDALLSASVTSVELFFQSYLEYMPSVVLMVSADKPANNALRTALSKKLPLEELDELMSILNIPEQHNFHKIEEYDLVVSDNLEEHVNRYKWLYARYGDERDYTVEEAREKREKINKEEFLKARQADKEKLQKAISKAKGLLGEDAYLVDIFQYIVYFRTQRTDVINRAAFLALPMLHKKAEELGLEYEDFLMCTYTEVLSGSIPSKDEISKRKERFCLVWENGTLVVLSGLRSKEQWEHLQEELIITTELQGVVACKGIARGKVLVIKNKNDFSRLKQGDVLVTSMTTPEMVPIMKLASAFVTDEGGVTCHAAIVSRELGKPCIIATKHATGIFKDGDMVEVDANKGMVRKI